MAGRTPADREREELLGLYKLALADYRFQVRLNWDRTRYFLALNVAITCVSTFVVRLPEGAPSVAVELYVLGALLSLLSIVALRAQRKYYISAREQKKRFEEKLGLGEHGITPVARSKGKLGRLATFKGIVDIMFVSLAMTDIGCAFLVVVHV